jgi:hypothetical protein
MGEVAGLEIAFRLAVAVFVIVTPTLMFLGLVRLLESIRDDDLVYRLLTEEDLRQIERSHTLASFVGEVTGEASNTMRCRSCGTITLAGLEACHECGSKP